MLYLRKLFILVIFAVFANAFTYEMILQPRGNLDFNPSTLNVLLQAKDLIIHLDNDAEPVVPNHKRAITIWCMALYQKMQVNNHRFNSIKFTGEIRLLTNYNIARNYLSPIAQLVTIIGRQIY